MTPAPAVFHSRCIAPPLWMLLVLGAIELLVVHFLLALWWRPAALLLSSLSAVALVWLSRGVLGLRTRPSTVEGGMLYLRAGRIATVAVPLEQVASVQLTENSTLVKRRGVRNMAMLSQPNVLVKLTARTGRYDAVAHRLDDPAAFAAVLDFHRGAEAANRSA